MEKCCGVLPRDNGWQSRMKTRAEIQRAKKEAQLEVKKELKGLSKAEKSELAMIKLQNAATLLADVFDPHRHTVS